MKRLMISLFGALAFAGAAQAAEPPATPAADTTPAVQDQAKAPQVNERNCLRHTGTRINTRTDRHTQRPCTGAMGSAYTREDLERTGDINIADALRRLDTSIH